YKYIDNESIELLGEIPYDRDYAVKYAKGNLFGNISENITSVYRNIAKKMEKQIIGHEGADYFKW
ncbi:MAG: cobyrinic acid a,c-diamide synthase, partial [Bacteroidales bacterium]|nr:cobyrinic acid a,c-diamide synthase [Bacteroidales bacterium]